MREKNRFTLEELEHQLETITEAGALKTFFEKKGALESLDMYENADIKDVPFNYLKEELETWIYRTIQNAHTNRVKNQSSEWER